ncbi:MAG: hypothetical protein S4CHLAM81_06510 [Chlamydiales bacterium]|nr:hypothetical protein [Chlamydiales bacterium]MCH9635435.1 hypothetical protein [Chlamydiales bacterium]MCH9703630.1 hypothetical protein [Chlamydiota bacterium]
MSVHFKNFSKDYANLLRNANPEAILQCVEAVAKVIPHGEAINRVRFRQGAPSSDQTQRLLKACPELRVVDLRGNTETQAAVNNVAAALKNRPTFNLSILGFCNQKGAPVDESALDGTNIGKVWIRRCNRDDECCQNEKA